MTRKYLAIFVLLLTAGLAAQAQSNYAVVRGSVLDPQHRAIPGAHVHITATETGVGREVVSITID